MLLKIKLGRQAGLSLPEMMVGMVIAMVLTIVVLQVVGVVELQSRTTIGAADSQTNGTIAMYTIERDLQVAGFSLMPQTDSGLECTTFNLGTSGVTSFSPVAVADGVASAGVSASDTITVRYGNALKGGIFSQITAAPVGNSVSVTNNLGCRVNDIALIVSGTTCTLSRISGPADLDTPAVASTTTVQLNDAASNPTVAAAAAAGANLACLGTWTESTYTVANGTLMRNGVPLLAGIVNLQVQYGISGLANSNVITGWVDPSGATWAAPSVADRNRIKAVRVAVVARSDRMEANDVTTACSSTTAAAPTGLCAWAGSAASPAPVLDLSQGDPNWRRYRYRVYESIIPVRNMIWARETL